MRPGPGLLRLLALWLLLGLAAAFAPAFVLVWFAAGFLFALFALSALLVVRRLPIPTIERDVPGMLPLGVFTPVTLRLRNPAGRTLDVEIFDFLPESFEQEGLPHRLKIPAGGKATLEYRVRPRERGDLSFEPAQIQMRSPGELWLRLERAGPARPVRVVPNVRAVTHYAILALSDSLGQIGLRVEQRRGEGLEFRELREYREGDSLRRIDWKATSRRNQLISREYQDERNQQVVFLLDCGRRMRTADGDLTHFDQVLNTVLLLTWVALRQGDAVGFLTFSGVERWLPPVRGNVAMEAVLRSVYDLQTTTQPADYSEAATRLMTRQKRRALVILISNLRDEDTSELVPALRLLRTRNLVLVASLRETVLRDAVDRPIETVRDAFRVAATHHYLAAREAVLEKLQLGGILTLDVEPEALPLRIVNRYLDIKRSGML